MRFASTVCDCVEDPVYDVGVVLEAGETCPAMPGRGASRTLSLYMDDEDSSNNNGRSGWLGQTVSNANTRFNFCSVSGPRFRPATALSPALANYAVVKMGTTCPAGSSTWTPPSWRPPACTG